MKACTHLHVKFCELLDIQIESQHYYTSGSAMLLLMMEQSFLKLTAADSKHPLLIYHYTVDDSSLYQDLIHRLKKIFKNVYKNVYDFIY